MVDKKYQYIVVSVSRKNVSDMHTTQSRYKDHNDIMGHVRKNDQTKEYSRCCL